MPLRTMSKRPSVSTCKTARLGRVSIGGDARPGVIAVADARQSSISKARIVLASPWQAVAHRYVPSR